MKPGSRSTLARQEQCILGWDNFTSPIALAVLRILGIMSLLLCIAMMGVHP